ncbi:hypothetical protein OTK51_20805, partial [Vibrio scophthalmi]|uniref:hypothetical protein n=1 Tax=Vibrio scophthalmi TaxID=45658 RepID=UPI002284428B
ELNEGIVIAAFEKGSFGFPFLFLVIREITLTLHSSFVSPYKNNPLSFPVLSFFICSFFHTENRQNPDFYIAN